MGAFRLVFNASALLLALAGASLLGFAALQTQPLDWQSLALGRLLAEAGAFPPNELLLFTAPERAYDASSWGWDLLGAAALRLGGEGLLRGADAAALLLAAIALAGTAFKRGARPFSAALFSAWALLAARPDLHPGPALLAWAIFVGALWLLEGPLERMLSERWIWLPPLALLAVNLHAGAWALGLLAVLWLGFERGASPWARAGLALAVLACLSLHPQGPTAHWQAWRTLGPSPLWPGAFEPRQWALLLLAFGALVLTASAWTSASQASQGRDRALLAGFAALGLASRDALPWALAVAAPIAALRFDQVVDSLPGALRSLRWPLKLLLLGAGITLMGRGALLAPPTAPQIYPQQTLAFYEQELLNLRILCPPDWTAYLAHRLAPQAAFAIDARHRAPAALEASLGAALKAGGSGAGALLKDAGVEAAWLPLGSPLAVALAPAAGWQPVAVDNHAVLYVRDLPSTRELIRVHAPRGLRLGDPERPFDPSRQAQAEADLETRLARDPSLGILYLFQAELWLAQGQEAKARQTLEAGIRADPASAWPYARLGALRAQRGDAAEARLLYQKALRRLPRREWRDALAALGAR